MKKIFFLLALSLVVGCGGGSSSKSPKIVNLDGIWKGNLALGVDECFLKVNPLMEAHQVSIDGDHVILISTDGRFLEGTADSSSSFQVQFSDGATFPTSDTVTYTSIENGVATVEIEHVYSRPGGCVTIWTGTMYRQ